MFNTLKISPIFILIIILSIIFFLVIINNKCKVENFNTSILDNNYHTKKDNDLYDTFYSNYYDNIYFCKDKNNYEIKSIIKKTNMNTKSNILDIGSGTGHHINILDGYNFKIVGLDKSHAMVNKSKQLYPSSKFINGDALNSMLFYDNIFTHILCLSYTLYYMENKSLFFNNCYKWLIPGGYLAIHLVDREKFSPIIINNDILKFDNIIHNILNNNKRITKNETYLTDNINYKTNFEYYPENNLSLLKETFTNNNNVRVQEHSYYMENHNDILNIAQGVGFSIISNINMECINNNYKYQYIYILKKSL